MNLRQRTILPILLLCFTALLLPVLLARFQVAAASLPTARSASQIYSKYCVACHGQDGKSQTRKGKYSHARDLTDGEWQDDVSDERLFNSIMNGRNVRGNMPSFSNKLNEKEADSLVGLVRKFRK